MQLLKYFAIFLIALVAIFIILGIWAPKDYLLERSIVINAPQEVVFDHMVHFQKWSAWSPWKKYDPEMKESYSGEDGSVGSSYSWKGNDNVGEGIITNKKITDSRMDYEMLFMKPFESQSEGWLSAERTGTTTTAIWGFKTHYDFPFNVMMMFMDMDKTLGKNFDDGLTMLKRIVEEEVDTKETVLKP
ncbi:SRPBCC family protein [Solitalea sp. MAHUQ-68]|uniref:SRPBCC family protein n=1 Tax=Solitalea agri TaxID=2953739 RepID=A0A9X2JD06_9SPHI|nr:SRPBCC family protein [Solitalea agri]MCO4293618.1 SRPBCC family protein [Solitalea agri]